MKLGNLWTTPLWLQAPNESQAPAHFFLKRWLAMGLKFCLMRRKFVLKHNGDYDVIKARKK